MAKPKNPLFSLEAHGTVGDSLTFQRRSGVDFVRRKPTPIDPMTNAQMYHRWDYLDYAYLWRQLSAAEQAAWRVIGTRTGITGFNAFMSNRLLTLPDLVARWRMDEQAGITVYDSSKNSNTGTCTGAAPAAGILASCRYFDGIDDWINCGNDPSLDITTEFTWLMWFYRVAVSAGIAALFRRDTAPTWGIEASPGSINLRARFLPIVGPNQLTGWLAVPLGQWHFLVGRYAPPILEIRMWGDAGASANVGVHTIRPGINNFHIGRDDPIPGRYQNAYIDDLTLYNRALADIEIDRHMERRLPL